MSSTLVILHQLLTESLKTNRYETPIYPIWSQVSIYESIQLVSMWIKFNINNTVGQVWGINTSVGTYWEEL